MPIDTGKTIHPCPTQGEAIKKLADACNRSRLTPLVKRMLAALAQLATGVTS